MAETKPTAPTLHLNGTSFDELSAQYGEATEAVQRALRALPSPNGRDYYPAGPAAYDAARREHDVRCARLRAVLDELVVVFGDINDQNDARASRRAAR